MIHRGPRAALSALLRGAIVFHFKLEIRKKTEGVLTVCVCVCVCCSQRNSRASQMLMTFPPLFTNAGDRRPDERSWRRVLLLLLPGLGEDGSVAACHRLGFHPDQMQPIPLNLLFPAGLDMRLIISTSDCNCWFPWFQIRNDISFML